MNRTLFGGVLIGIGLVSLLVGLATPAAQTFCDLAYAELVAGSALYSWR